MQELPKLWTPAQLAEACGIGQQYIRKLLRGEQKKNRIRGWKVGRSWLIPEEEALRYLEARKQQKQQK